MSHTFVIADLHGRADVLEKALAAIEAYFDGGTVVFLGDYVDRGPSSRQVVERLMRGPVKPGWLWLCLKGNHEDMLVYAMQGGDRNTWPGNGGYETLNSFGGTIPEDVVHWMDGLPLYFKDRHRVFVHAGIDPRIPMASQNEVTLLWQRVPAMFDYDYPEGYVVHGHTPLPECPIILEGRANLDSGACWSGRIEVAVFDDARPGKPVEMLRVECPSLEELSRRYA